MSNTVFGLWIINKAGGLIYNRDFAEGLAKLSSNEYLVLASTFHSIHAIAARISPAGSRSSGIQTVEGDTFKMTCMQTMTGTKFVLITSPAHASPDTILKRIYEAYAEQLKDPFYTVEMSIRSEVFESRVQSAVKAPF